MIFNKLSPEDKQKVIEYLQQEMQDLRRASYAEDKKIEEYQTLMKEYNRISQERQDIFFVKRIVSHDQALLDSLTSIIANRDGESTSSLKFKLEFAQSEKQSLDLEYERIEKIIKELENNSHIS